MKVLWWENKSGQKFFSVFKTEKERAVSVKKCFNYYDKTFVFDDYIDSSKNKRAISLYEKARQSDTDSMWKLLNLVWRNMNFIYGGISEVL